jgi:hypothetical protein
MYNRAQMSFPERRWSRFTLKPLTRVRWFEKHRWSRFYFETLSGSALVCWAADKFSCFLWSWLCVLMLSFQLSLVLRYVSGNMTHRVRFISTLSVHVNLHRDRKLALNEELFSFPLQPSCTWWQVFQEASLAIVSQCGDVNPQTFCWFDSVWYLKVWLWPWRRFWS